MATTTTNSAKTYTPISWTSLGSSTNTVTLSSIPSGYTDLRLVISGGVGAVGGNFGFQFNGDSGSNYSNRNLYASGTTPSSSYANNSSQINATYSTGGPVEPIVLEVDIFQYTNTSVYKTMISQFGNNQNSSAARTEVVAGLWRSTSAITSIVIQSNGILTGTTFGLYGILAA